MKRIMTALLAVMAIMLTACGTPAESSPQRENPAPQTEKLIKEFEYGYRIYTVRPVLSAKDSLYYLNEI